MTRTNSENSKFSSGDRVVVMAPSHFAAYEWVPEFACCKLQPHEELTVCCGGFILAPSNLRPQTLSTVPLCFSTALYALEDRVSLRSGEVGLVRSTNGGCANREQTILIHSAVGGLGIAAVQIARLKGAEVSQTNSSMFTLSSRECIDLRYRWHRRKEAVSD